MGVTDGLPPGWLNEVEADALRHAAARARVLELGSWKGRSTVVMAQTAQVVVAVDSHKGIPGHEGIEWIEGPSLKEFLANVAPFDNIIPVVGDWHDIAWMWRAESFGLVFVDGWHDRASTKRDLLLAQRLSCDLIACHDWDLDEVREGARDAGLGDPYATAGSIVIWDVWGR